MENKIQYRLIKKFGPSIFHVKIPEEIVTKLNNYIDETIKDNDVKLVTRRKEGRCKVGRKEGRDER